MFVLNYRISAADEFYDGAVNNSVYGDVVMSAGKSYFMADYNGDPIMDGNTAVDYIILSLLKTVECLDSRSFCRFSVTFQNDGYISFEREGDELIITEKEYCNPSDDFTEKRDESGDMLASEKVSYSLFRAEIIGKSHMFMNELGSADMRLLNCSDVKKIEAMLDAFSGQRAE